MGLKINRTALVTNFKQLGWQDNVYFQIFPFYHEKNVFFILKPETKTKLQIIKYYNNMYMVIKLSYITTYRSMSSTVILFLNGRLSFIFQFLVVTPTVLKLKQWWSNVSNMIILLFFILQKCILGGLRSKVSSLLAVQI